MQRGKRWSAGEMEWLVRAAVRSNSADSWRWIQCAVSRNF